VESVEPAGIGNELWPLRLEHLPNRLVRKLGVLVGLGVGDASIKQPGVFLNRSRGVKNRSRTNPTWFSTCPFSQRVKAAKHLLILFRFGHKNSRPIHRRSTCLESLYACPVQIKEHPQAEIVLGRPTQLDRLQRTFPIAASITVNHGRP
jgi:hypothetical protein